MKTRFRNICLTLFSGCFLLSCAHISAPTHKEIKRPIEEDAILIKSDIGTALKNGLEEGLVLDCNTLSLSFPSKNDSKPNVFTVDGARVDLALTEPSFHGLGLNVNLPLDYNGVRKDAYLTLLEERLFFSLTDLNPSIADGNGGIRFQSSIARSEEHAGEEDIATRGITYFEYGSLDYFLYSVFDAFGISTISLSSQSEESGISLDFEAISDSFSNLEKVDAQKYKLSLPIGNDVVPVGIRVDSKDNLSGIEFPLGGGNRFTFEDGFSLGFVASIAEATPNFTPAFDTSTYLELEDSLDMVKGIGDLVGKKTFGLEANLTVRHIEDEVVADDEHFARDPISETATLTASLDADLSTPYHDLNANVALSCAGKTESIILHFDDDSGDPVCFFNFNGVLKGFSNIETISHIASTLSDTLSDESVQNQTLLRLLSGLIATSDSLKEAIDAITGSDVYANIDEEHYESLIASITRLGHSDNRIDALIDLSKAGGSGSIRLTIDSSAASLINLTFIDAGVITSSSPKLTLLLNGSISTRDYVKKTFNKTGYSEYRHLPSLDDSLSRFSESDKLTVSLEGYLSKKGTTAVSNYTVPSWNGTSSLRTQGFSFAGKFGFDLKAKTGTGQATFEDHKKNYFNDHNLKIDVTGDKLSTDSDSKDYLGTEGNTNYMLVEYNSKNNNSAYANTYNKNLGNRTAPNNSSLKGRFSINSLDGILDLVADLLTSTDPRFKRLTNLFNDLTTASTIGTILDGHYLEAVASGFLSASTINSNTVILTCKPGLIKADYPLQIRVSFGEDYTDSEGVLRPGKIRTLEILSTCPSSISDGNDIYVKITFDSVTEIPAFNFNKSTYTSFLPLSSLKHLVRYLMDTITLGVTDTSEATTYKLKLTITLNVKVGLISNDYNIVADVFVFMDGTNLRLIAQLSYPKTPSLGVLIDQEGKTTIYYKSDGNADNSELYIRRSVKDSKMDSSARVRGSDFSKYLAQWLGYILNFSSTIRNQLNDTDSSGGQKAIHGEDLVRSFGIVSGSSLSAPQWNATISLNAILPDSVARFISIANIVATIGGKTVKNPDGKDKQSLYSLTIPNTQLTIEFGISINALKARVSATMENISGINYVAAWNNSSYKVNIHKANVSGRIFKTYSIGSAGSATAYNMFNNSNTYGKSYGMTSANTDYSERRYSTLPPS